MRVSIICSSGTGPRACGAAPASLRAHPRGLGLGAGRDRGGARWSPGPCAGHRYWGEKEGGNVFCLFSVLQITVNPARSALSPTPSPARTPLPCQRIRTAWGRVLLVPGGHALCPRGGQAAHPQCQAEREVPHVPRRAVPGARARPSGCCCPGTRSAGGVAGAPRGAGGHAEALGRRCCPPSQSTGCQGGGQRGCSALAPHCTPLTQPGEVPRGWRGTEQGDSCDIPGCHTRPPCPPLLPAVPRVSGQPWGPSLPRRTLLRATPSTGSRGAPSARPPRGGWGGRQAVISAGVN